MKKLLSLSVAVFAVFGMSSCCCMFGGRTNADYREVTKQSKFCGAYDIVTEEVPVASTKGGMAKGGMTKGGMTKTVERKVPRYKTVKERVPCNNCWRFYCTDRDCCGTTGKKTRRLASAQGHSGSPNIGLIPTMKPLKDWP